MARGKTVVTLNTKVLDGILKNTDRNVAEAVAKVAFTVEANAKILAPVDTGALRASIYTSLAHGGNGSQAMTEARTRNPDANVLPLPEPQDDHTAYVGPSVEYGLGVEIGTRRRPATPYLLPAARKAERDLMGVIGVAVLDK